MTEDIVRKVHALGLGVTVYQSGQLVVSAHSDEDAKALELLGFRAGGRAQRFPGRKEPGLLIECTWTPPSEAGDAVSDSPGADAPGQT
jgi:hypothetical protein